MLHDIAQISMRLLILQGRIHGKSMDYFRFEKLKIMLLTGDLIFTLDKTKNENWLIIK